MRITFDGRAGRICSARQDYIYHPKPYIKAHHTFMRLLSTRMLSAGLSIALLLTAACNRNDDNGPELTPKGPPPSWAPGIHKEMQVVIEQLDSFHVAAVQTLSPQAARMQKTALEAADMVAKTYGLAGPLATADTLGRDIPAAGGNVHARIYKPGSGNGPFPAIFYFHGGGWVIGDAWSHDASARALAEQTGAVVVSVEYRLAPEYKFPTAHNDAFTAYKWIIENAASLGINPTRIAVAGEGAGANLACNVSIAARNAVIKVPDYQLLVYPIAQGDFTTPSYMANASALPLNKPVMQWYFGYYLNSMAEAGDPRISLINANLAGLPPTLIINAEIDPLLDDGLQLETKLKAAGVSTTRKIFNGVTHDFFGMAVVLPEAREAQGMAARELITALN
jgi:acetyl esterase/lipase